MRMPFSRTGGRRPGSKNKATLAREKALAGLVVDAKDPMSFFVSVMRDETAPFEKREAAADRLLPFFHPKLSAVEGRLGEMMTHEDRLAKLQRLLEDD